ncbi:protein CFAP20DC isoform X3 [Pipra filicauda]|uniref:Protein CFAP20DC isoform X3 n=1 Tax=Pipra filicauda TaxID=649802 RepID=A0A7R5KR90_9PASS|nr:protein CFAP20DC isoform X3 [Pipra filicauda]
MFKNHYQGGRFVEIFSAQGKNPGAKWKIFGNPSAIWKEYDKELKGFVFVLEGSSQVNKMQLPKETRQTLGLIQQFLTLQIFVPLGKDFSTELLITDLGNIKRRLYLSTVHKELSVTPLHAKIPLFMIKRKIWCNMCIDLAAFTSEIFRGAVFQSLDGIIISANCKLRKIFTLKSKPQDTAEENVTRVVPSVPRDPTDVIPRTCQLNRDVPQVTQLLNLTKIQKPEVKCREYPVQETGSLVNRGQGNIHSSKTQDVSHIAFGSKILGPPPSSNRRVSTKVPGEKIMSFKVTKTSGSKSNRSCQLQNSGMPAESIQDIERLELSFSSCNDYLDQGGKRNTHQTTEDTCQNDEWDFPGSFTESIRLDRSEQFIATEDSACHHLNSSQNASVEHHSSETGDQQVNNKEIFTFSSRPRSAPHGKSPNMSPERYVFPLDLEPDSNRVREKTQDNFQGTDSSEEDDNNGLIQGSGNLEISHCRQGTSDSAVFKEISLKKMAWKTEYWKNKEHSKHNLDETILPNPQSSTVRKTDSISSQRSLKPILSLSPTQSKSKFFKAIRNGSEKTERYEGVSDQLERSVSKMSLKKISKENSCLTAQTCEYDWRNNNSNMLSSSELQMLTSMKRQQNEELRDTGISHGLSTSQIDTCNVNISTSGDDNTATWNSLLPPPVSQEHHYQREMSLLSHSNPRDWSNVFSPPIIPGSQQLEEHTKSSIKQNIQGEDDFNAEEDEEGLTLLYDPCLYRYFDPNSGKYYELA